MQQTNRQLGLSDKLSDFLHSIANVKPMKKNTFLFSEGEKANELFIVHSGKIQVGKLSPDGRELTLRICEKGDMVGEIALYDDSNYILNGKVLEDGEVGVINKGQLESYLLDDIQLAIEFIKQIGEANRRDQTRLRDLVLHGKKGALYSTLIRLSNSYGRIIDQDTIYIEIVLTNQELANFCGTSRESVNRSLNDLKRQNIISIKKSHILIHDLLFLKREINCENCPITLCSIH